MRDTLFIFDCDGVLVDSEELASEVLSLSVAGLGLVMTAADAEQRFRGRSLADCLLAIEGLLGGPLPESFLPSLQAQTKAAFAGKLQPVSQVEEVLTLIAKHGLRRCVASNGELAKMRYSLALTGLLPFFESASDASLLFSAEQVERGKPAPDLFLFAARQMATAPEHCLVIEDSPAGVKAALAASMKVMAYLPKGSPRARDHIFAHPSVTVFSSMGELRALITEALIAEVE